MPPTPPPIPAQAVVEPVPDAWGTSDVSWDAAAADGDDWGAEESEWGAGVGTEGIGGEATPDIGALLDEQEKRSSKAQEDRAVPPPAAGRPQGGGAREQPTPAEPQANGSSARQPCRAGASEADAAVAPVPSAAADEAENGGGKPCFPAKTVSFRPEPWGADSSRADKDMENRLRRYREQEEDRGLVAALDQALGLKGGGGVGNGGGQQGGGGRVASIGEKYERTPAT